MSTGPVNHQQQHHPHVDSYSSPPVTLILTIVLLIFFFVGFFSIYFCRCFMDYVASATRLLHRNPSGNTVGNTGSAAQGLDPSIISSFPTFVYSTVKDLREDKGDLECAVCLSEFEENDVLRLLTVCNHVFHPECIDLWFESHKTCPVCRRNLDPSENSPEKPTISVSTIPETDEHEDESREETLSIVVKEEGEEGRGAGAAVDMSTQGGEGNGVERFPRSHSTGHSIVMRGREDDRFTLRLPDNVKMRITGSCITFGEFSCNAAASGKGGLGELSGFSGGVVATV